MRGRLRGTYRANRAAVGALLLQGDPEVDLLVRSSESDGGDGFTPLTLAVETVEGFWIERPWLLAEQCPKELATAPGEPTTDDAKGKDAADAPAPLPPREHTAGIAQYFTPADSRVGTRAGRDYVKVVTLAEGQTAPKGMMLLVEGRLRAWPDGKIIECRDSRTGGRPICIAGITVDRVAFERADDRTVVAEWTN